MPSTTMMKVFAACAGDGSDLALALPGVFEEFVPR